MSADSSSTSSQTVIDLIESPPTSAVGILMRLGPGLVIAGSIVGSGELIATTATGAQAGFWLLWLILVGCVIKVFVQVEFGRYSIATGQGTMEGLEQVPGPRIRGRGNWLVWYWVLMFCASLAQLGGIVGGVGQALAISVPLTASGRAHNEQFDLETRYKVALAELNLAKEQSQPDDEKIASLFQQIEQWGPQIVAMRRDEMQKEIGSMPAKQVADDKALARARQIVNHRAELFPGQPEKIFATRQQLEGLLLKQRKALLGEKFNQEQAERYVKQQLDEIHAGIAPAPDKKVADAADKLVADFGQRKSIDDKLWATIIAVVTSILLVIGRYGLIQTLSTFMVATFTVITIVNLIALQRYGEWAITWQDLANGFRFSLPPHNDEALTTALKTFGIIGVGASELIAYPYWCLEKGYARFTGPNDNTDAWASRARGWLRVMRWDAWCSMGVYTFATIAFYLLGAAILGRIHLEPHGTEMIRTLSTMYAPVFGEFTQILFLFGAFAVLYSTFFVANAGQARMCADAMQVTGLARKSHTIYRRNVQWLSGLFPLVCMAVYWVITKPAALVLFSGLMQAMMLPMLSFAALYFRYRRSDRRIAPGRVWDVFLLVSSIGMLIAGSWAGYSSLASYLGW